MQRVLNFSAFIIILVFTMYFEFVVLIRWKQILSMLNIHKTFYPNRNRFVSEKRSTAIIAYLLEHAHSNPNCVDTTGRRPLDLTSVPEHFRLLLKFGATPNDSQLQKFFPKQFDATPADMSIKMFMLGNPGAGKSTLVKSITMEGGVLSRIKYRFSQVEDVDESTAGIIPYDISSKALGRTTLYDFAGHREFYSGHDALLQSAITDSQTIVMIIVDVRGDEGQIRECLHYWFEFVNTHTSKGSSVSHLVIVGSHADKMPSKEIREKSSFLQSIARYHNLDNISIAGQVMLDCRYAESPSMSQLRSILSQSCQVLRSSEKMAVTHHCFLLFLFDKFRGQTAVMLSEAATALNQSEQNHAYACLNMMVRSNLIEVCECLNKHGDILFVKNKEQPEKSWIVFDKGILLATVNGVIFAPEGFKEHANISTSTGVVPQSMLTSLFPNLDSKMISQFMCHLEFCQEIQDLEVLELLHANTSSSCSDEKFLFFPGLVDLNVPTNVWLPNSQFGYYSGWLLQCTIRGQFFSSRFLQVLLLRLAYGLAFLPSDRKPSSSDPASPQRSCCVWKRGICWSDQSGIEVIVEVVDQKCIVVMIRALKQIESQVKLISVRSQIIQRVLDTKHDFCPKVNITEALLHPEVVNSYPLDLTKVKQIKMSTIADAVVEGKVGVHDSTDQMVDLRGGLLYFEPYAGMDRSTLEELFKEENKTIAKDDFLYDVAKDMHKNIEYVIELFKPCPIRLANLMDRAPPGNVHKLVRVFQLWREENDDNGTMYNLRQKFDQFSIFAGRNPLELCS